MFWESRKKERSSHGFKEILRTPIKIAFLFQYFVVPFAQMLIYYL